MASTVLKARDIRKNYLMGKSELEVLNGVDLSLEEGRILAIVGESGAGKSTLLHILGMLDRPSSGYLELDGEDLMKKTDAELAIFRNRFVGFIFQFHHLLPEFTALENVAMPALIEGKSLSDSRGRAEHLIDRVGLSGRLDHRPNELSGGELQRIAVARALMNEPAMVFADEPSGNLDHRNSEMLHDLIWDLARETMCAFIVVTHDLALAKRADEIQKLEDGVLHTIDRETITERIFY